jgi:hypothetical protein
VTLEELAATLQECADRASASMARDVVDQMAQIYLPILKSVTPVETGKLRDSEVMNSISGGGAFAQAQAGPHMIYAQFRNDGGTIHSHGPWSLSNGSQYFGRVVTQKGSHYMEKAQAAASGPCEAAARKVMDEYTTGL